MRLIILSMLLVGCATAPEPDPAPSPNPDNITKVGEKIDRSEQLAAAAITVAVEQADKPEVVRGEGKVALAYLVKPTDEDVTVARVRASNNDQKVYTAQIESAKQMQAKIEEMWNQAEAEAKKSKADIQALKTRNEELLSEIERIKKDASANVWTITGAFLVVAGGLACAFASVRVGVPIIIAGAFAGAVPFIIDSQYFSIIAGTTLSACAALAIWWMYDKVRDNVNSNDDSPKQP